MPRMESPETGTEQRVTIRVHESLLDEYDEMLDEMDSNRSEHLRRHIRRTIDAPDESDDGLVPPQDDDLLNKSYLALRRHSGGQAMPLDEAKSIVARHTNIGKESVSRRVLHPLKDRGYLKFLGSVREKWVRVR